MKANLFPTDEIFLTVVFQEFLCKGVNEKENLYKIQFKIIFETKLNNIVALYVHLQIFNTLKTKVAREIS